MSKLNRLLVVGIALTAPASPLAADPRDDCSGRCERNAAADRQSCAELPLNPSCRVVVEKNRLRCLDYCERTYPGTPGQPSAPPSGDKI